MHRLDQSSMDRPAALAPPGVLLLLVLAVLAVHVLLLRSLRPPPAGPAPLRGVVFTRAIEVPVPAAAEANVLPRPAPAAAAPESARTEAKASTGAGTGSSSAGGGRLEPPPEPQVAAPAAPAGAGVAEPPPPPAIPPNVRRGPAAAWQPGAAPAGDVLLPESVELRYAVSGQLRRRSVEGSTLLHWRHDGARYEARLETAGASVRPRVQSSTGLIGTAGLEPTRYSDRGRSEMATHFQRDAGKVSFSATPMEAALATGMQDRVSALVQLAGIVAAQPQRFPPGSTIELPTAGTRMADAWQLSVEGEETLVIGEASLPTLRLLRRSRSEYEPALELWLAPGLDYLPARIRLTWAHGDWVEQLWRSTDRP